ncbi:hypothetical protein Goklo_008341, partial [Gossypium klotzschianum]|nr:hypothetical protein [Gossypium klotzschianum]
TKKRVNIFALSIYGLVIFLKALGHINDAISDLFDWLDKRVTLVLAILAETFRYLSACRRAGEGRFIEELLSAERICGYPQNKTTFLKKNGWKFFRVSKTKTLN